MKIAIMMRPIDQPSAFQAFVEGLVDNMLTIDQENEYLLIYRTPKWFGRFREYINAKEVLAVAPHKFLWDQVAVPVIAWRERADVIYHPKFSVPLVSHCPVAMGLQEMAWRIWPRYYEKLDVLYQKTIFPIYCRKSKHFFPWSEFVLEEIRRYLAMDLRAVTITPPVPQEYFHPIKERDVLRAFKSKHDLPERFILCVTRVDHPGIDHSKSFFPGKNVDATVKAFRLCRDRVSCDLVIAGRRVKEYLLCRGFSESDLKGIRFLGFVDHDNLPLLFNLAQLFVMTSNYEGFGVTLLEAMACGCPAIAAKTGASPEVSGGAAVLADPFDPSDFAEKIISLLENEKKRQYYREKGIRRVSCFSWEKTARLTIEGLKKAARKT
jgi:glycosyltransferase involved in cell wall biosynthesis